MSELDAALNRLRGDGDDLTLIRREIERMRTALAAMSALAALAEYHASGIVIDRHGVYTVDGPYVLGEHDGTPGDIADVLTKATKDGDK